MDKDERVYRAFMLTRKEMRNVESFLEALRKDGKVYYPTHAGGGAGGGTYPTAGKVYYPTHAGGGAGGVPSGQLASALAKDKEQWTKDKQQLPHLESRMLVDPPMKVSFMVEITGCDVDEALCPHMRTEEGTRWCTKEKSWPTSLINVMENTRELTKTCPMVRAQFEALE